jgi:hypothetical protein
MRERERNANKEVASSTLDATGTFRVARDPGTEVDVSKVVRALFLAAGGLVVVHLLGLVSTYGFGHGNVLGLVPFFNLDQEVNAPSWFSSALALVGAGLFFVLWRRLLFDGKRSREWLILSLIFVFVSVDESVSVHERLIRPVREWLDLSGLLYFAWVVPYGLAVVILAVALLPFFWRLEPEAWQRFIMAAAIYLTGAVGLELIGGLLFESLGEKRNLAYDLVITCEESLEMAGLILLIRAQLLSLGKHHPVMQVSLR